MFQHQKAVVLGKDETAKLIKKTGNPHKCKALGDQLGEHDSWDRVKVPRMMNILIGKYKNSPQFRETLHLTGRKTLVEATTDGFWASGLKKQYTTKRNPDEWPGKNKMGQLLMLLRDDETSRKETRSDELSLNYTI